MKILVLIVTLMRLPMTIATVWYTLHDQWALALYCFYGAIVTDLADGWLARRLNVCSRLGAGADTVFDIAMFWIYAVGAYWYALEHNPDLLDIGNSVFAIAFFTAVLIGFMAWESQWFQALWKWWWDVGNFWIGAIGVAGYGLWIAAHGALVVTGLYLVLLLLFWRLRQAGVWTRTALDALTFD